MASDLIAVVKGFIVLSPGCGALLAQGHLNTVRAVFAISVIVRSFVILD
jgi:hypothetical protein